MEVSEQSYWNMEMYQINTLYTSNVYSVTCQSQFNEKMTSPPSLLHSPPFEIWVYPQWAFLCSMNISLLSRLWDDAQGNPLSGISFFAPLASENPLLSYHPHGGFPLYPPSGVKLFILPALFSSMGTSAKAPFTCHLEVVAGDMEGLGGWLCY